MCAAHFHFQAKNEQDPSAIAALLQSLRLDPGNCEAIIALAASLTNESMQSHACYALQGRLFEKLLKKVTLMFGFKIYYRKKQIRISEG